jgi:hypothetical protein
MIQRLAQFCANLLMTARIFDARQVCSIYGSVSSNSKKQDQFTPTIHIESGLGLGTSLALPFVSASNCRTVLGYILSALQVRMR